MLLAAAVVDFLIAMFSGEYGVKCAPCSLHSQALSAPEGALAEWYEAVRCEAASQAAEQVACRSAFLEPGVILLILAANGELLQCCPSCCSSAARLSRARLQLCQSCHSVS